MLTTQDVLRKDMEKLLNSVNKPHYASHSASASKMTNYAIWVFQGAIQLENCSLNGWFKFTRKACKKNKKKDPQITG